MIARLHLARFRRDQDGTASIEFALLFPAVLWVFMLGMEMALIQIRQTMVERGMDVIVRDLRLGDPDLLDPEKMKKAVCDEILVMPDCEQDIMLEMGPVQVRDFAYREGKARCVNRNAEANPVINYTAGSNNEMMVLRFCILHDPIFPSVGLGKVLPKEPGGGYPLIASTFFVNEPR